MTTNKNKKITIPKHVVIIPNGNRTWAKKRGLKAWEGYKETYKNLNALTREAQKIGISHLTLWGFSTENWKRDAKEIEELFKIISLIVTKLKKSLIKEKIRFNHFGRKDRLPKNLLNIINELEKETKNFKNKSLNIALDYGGRDEILRSINKLLVSGKKEITENEFSNLLDTSMVPDPDLIIRTANEKRLSGMMPWQSTYAEYYFTDVYFPEFKAENLYTAVVDFSRRKRTFGGDDDKNKR